MAITSKQEKETVDHIREYSMMDLNPETDNESFNANTGTPEHKCVQFGIYRIRSEESKRKARDKS